jgi:DNA-binding response OmpR family regulator
MTGLTTSEAVAELRHELRTPLNLVIGYCEMLLEDAADPADRAALEAALQAGRDVLELVNTALAPSRSEISAAELDALFASLHEPQGRILEVTGALLGAGRDPQFAKDVRRIRSSAERLLTIELPAATAAAPTAYTAATREFAAADRPVERPARILVVDDQEDNRAVLERRLRRQGHSVSCAAGGYAALQLAAHELFDLVLLDVVMPDLDGYAVLERLKSDPATRGVPVIMISALDDVASVVRCLERGAEDHLPKPFDPVLLRARIGACLEKKRLRDAELEYLGQVARVIEAATRVEAGTYQSGALEEVGRRDDELGRLARVFDAMAHQVRAREERLREQVSALRREIEEAKQHTRETATPGAADQPGELIGGRYEILEEVGRGGMGTVYRARDRELGDQVALKILRPELVQGTNLVERFRSEIRLARHISDRHVVRTHDIGEWNGHYYLTMEFVEGITLRELLDTRGRLDLSPTLAIAIQLAQSLAAAHEQGVIHRDIKPHNLLLDAAGVLKVMDFGIAQVAGQNTGLTETGMVVGTPAYMAPEQMLGEEVDARADLYAAGIVLYECLTGRLPFVADTPVALIAKHLGEEPTPPDQLNPGIPAPVAALILRLLAKRPEDRPASAVELGALLAGLR